MTKQTTIVVIGSLRIKSLISPKNGIDQMAQNMVFDHGRHSLP